MWLGRRHDGSLLIFWLGSSMSLGGRLASRLCVFVVFPMFCPRTPVRRSLGFVSKVRGMGFEHVFALLQYESLQIHDLVGRNVIDQCGLHPLTHDCPFGGKLDACLVPSCFTLANFRVLRFIHSPLQSFSFSTVSGSSMSGSQRPDTYSLASASICCLRVSSRVLVGRPERREAWSVDSSAESRAR